MKHLHLRTLFDIELAKLINSLTYKLQVDKLPATCQLDLNHKWLMVEGKLVVAFLIGDVDVASDCTLGVQTEHKFRQLIL